MKSGKLSTEETSILRKVVWLHKVIYTALGRPAEYHHLSIPFFISRYLSVMAAEKESVQSYMIQHLQDIMGDAELYGSGSILAFHAVSLQKLKQGCVTSVYEEVKLKYRRAFMWHCVTAPTQPAQAYSLQPPKKP